MVQANSNSILQLDEAEFIAIRQRIHAHPELAFKETVTSALVADYLREWGYQVTTGIGKTGLVGQLKNGSSSRSIGIRADMDALPIQEQTNLPYASQIPGQMHACGHDGHTTILLAAAKHLALTRHFDGIVNLIFQPAEEGAGGAQRMMADGLFERFPCDMIYGLHNGPGLPAGSFIVQPGVLAASSDTVTITLHGKGAHGGMPQHGIDPVIAMASIVMSLQTIVSRNLSPDQPAVISIGLVQAGTAVNVIPETVKIGLTIRTFDPAVQAQIETRLRDLVRLQAESFGVRAEIDWHKVSRVLINHLEPTEFARAVVEKMVGKEHIVPLPAGAMGGDDFSWMLEKVPGTYLVLGNGTGSKGGCMIHNPGYDFNDEILMTGARLWVELTEAYLHAH